MVQRHRTATRADGFLAHQAAPQRHLLVDEPTPVPAHPDRGEHEVRAGERVLDVGGHPDDAAVPQGGGHLHGQPADRLPPRLVRLEQADLAERGAGAGQHTADEHGYPHPATAQDGQVHGMGTSPLRPATSISPTPPSLLTVSEPAALPAAAASVSDAPWHSAPISAPAKASPAPVRSRTSTR